MGQAWSRGCESPAGLLRNRGVRGATGYWQQHFIIIYRSGGKQNSVMYIFGWKWHQFSSVQLLSRVQLFVTPWTTACQASLSITNSRSLPKPMSIKSVMPSNHFILCHPLLLLPSIFPSIWVFSMSQLFTSGGQSIGVSASTSVKNISKHKQ